MWSFVRKPDQLSRLHVAAFWQQCADVLQIPQGPNNIGVVLNHGVEQSARVADIGSHVEATTIVLSVLAPTPCGLLVAATIRHDHTRSFDVHAPSSLRRVFGHNAFMHSQEPYFANLAGTLLEL